jgi:hypothetical protein
LSTDIGERLWQEAVRLARERVYEARRVREARADHLEGRGKRYEGVDVGEDEGAREQARRSCSASEGSRILC